MRKEQKWKKQMKQAMGACILTGGEPVLYRCTFDRKIYVNPTNRYCIIQVRTKDASIPREAQSKNQYRDQQVRFTAVGHDLPLTDAVEIEVEGEWMKGKYGVQFQVDQWQEIVPPPMEGLRTYLGSGLIKGIGPATAAEIVAKFGMDALEVLEKTPQRYLEIRGITQTKLEEIKSSYAQTRVLQDIITLLEPFKLTPKTAMKIYQYLGPTSIEILKRSPFELCQIPGFGFRRVDAILLKTNSNLHDPMRIKGAVICALDDARGTDGHLYLERENLIQETYKMLNEKIPLKQHHVSKEEIDSMLDNLILDGVIVSSNDNLYLPRVFAQEEEVARQIVHRVLEKPPLENVVPVLESVKKDFNIRLSSKQEQAVKEAFRYNLSVITGSPGTGKTTVLKTILEVYRRLHPGNKILLMAPTGRASRRMAESTGFKDAKTIHSILGLVSEEEEAGRKKEEQRKVDAQLIVIDEFSMVDMWLANQLFSKLPENIKIVLVGDPDQLPSVGAGNVFAEIISCGVVPVTVLNEIFRQAKDSLIAYNARFINSGNTKLYYGNDFVFINAKGQQQAADILMESYCMEVAEHGIEHVQILSPFRSRGEASVEQINATIREIINPFQSEDTQQRVGMVTFRTGDRIMQTQNTDKVSNGDLGFIRYIRKDASGTHFGVDFGDGRKLEYSIEEAMKMEHAYSTTIHKSMGSEYDIVLIPMVKAHSIMLYRNLLYTAITRAKKKVILVGEKNVLYMAIHENEITKRNTRLGERILLHYKAQAKSKGIPFPAVLDEKLKKAS